VVTPPASEGDSAKFSVSFHLPDLGERRPLGAAVAAAKLARLLRRGARFAMVIGEKRIDLGEAVPDDQMPDSYIGIHCASPVLPSLRRRAHSLAA
jgi:hypothetical protein